MLEMMILQKRTIQETMIKCKSCIHEINYIILKLIYCEFKNLNCKKCLSVVYVEYAILRNDDAAFDVM